MEGWARYCTVNDVKNGPYRNYLGTVRLTIGQFTDGKPDGTWTTLGKDGQIVHATVFDSGKVIAEVDRGL
jgi:hypothetical protein